MYGILPPLLEGRIQTAAENLIQCDSLSGKRRETSQSFEERILERLPLEWIRAAWLPRGHFTNFVKRPERFTEAPTGFEPVHKGFADLSLTTWVRRLVEAVHYTRVRKRSPLRVLSIEGSDAGKLRNLQHEPFIVRRSRPLNQQTAAEPGGVARRVMPRASMERSPDPCRCEVWRRRQSGQGGNRNARWRGRPREDA